MTVNDDEHDGMSTKTSKPNFNYLITNALTTKPFIFFNSFGLPDVAQARALWVAYLRF